MNRNQIKAIPGIFKTAVNNWSDNKAMMMGAAMAYYTLFSIAPLLMITIALAGWVFGAEASQGEVYRTLQGMLGRDGASSIQGLVESASNQPETGVVASVIGVATLLLGASGVFAQLQESLNVIWGVKPAPEGGVGQWLRRRVLSFSMVLVIAFLLLVSLVASAAFAGVGRFMNHALPGGSMLWQAVNFALSLAMTSALFAAIYKILPDVTVSWKEVRFGAVVTALLFSLGKLLIGLYLGRSSVGSAYGAAGSLVVVMVWVYYSSCILLLGAEFTHAYATRDGRRVRLRAGAVWVGDPMEKLGQRPPVDRPERDSAPLIGGRTSTTGR